MDNLLNKNYSLSSEFWQQIWFNKSSKFEIEHTEAYRLLKKIIAYILLFNQRQRHFYHMVTPSPWPFVFSIALMAWIFSFFCYLHFISNAGYHFMVLSVCLLATFFFWFKDIFEESKLSHTWKIEYLITDSFILFIVSEVMFFFSFFWAFFYSSLSPSLWICNIWPPLGFTTANTFDLPLLNTALLLYSGWTVSLAHDSIIRRSRADFLLYLGFTLYLSSLFTCVQFIEYRYSCFSIYDSVYGSCFFMLTGFHGFHVILGTVMLIICWIRGYYYHFGSQIHVGFIISSWYWHFVDVVWIFLFLIVYWWGNSSSFFDIDLTYIDLDTIRELYLLDSLFSKVGYY